ncbi:MAG: GNAT family N-acetyltransferase [Elusimicrobiales bacterium]|nr:GNAT family N-acetyltransferase [Elusimicrobiales bacterium]
MKVTRLASGKDKKAAAALMAASDPWRALGLGPAHCLATFSVPFRETYMIKEGGALAGLVTITMYGTFRGYIQSLFTAPGFRGRGLGEALMRFAEKKIFARSPNVFLCVSSFNKGALRFYRRLGYKKAGVLKDFFRKGSDEILMRKTLGPLRDFAPRRN